MALRLLAGKTVPLPPRTVAQVIPHKNPREPGSARLPVANTKKGPLASTSFISRWKYKTWTGQKVFLSKVKFLPPFRSRTLRKTWATLFTHFLFYYLCSGYCLSPDWPWLLVSEKEMRKQNKSPLFPRRTWKELPALWCWNPSICVCVYTYMGFPGGSVGKESACNVEDLGSIPGLGRSPGEGKGYPLQYSGLENPMDYIVHEVAENWTWLSNFQFTICVCVGVNIYIWLWSMHLPTF